MAKQTTTKNEPAPQPEETKTLATQQQTSGEIEIYDGGEDAGAGMENVTMDERKLPFLRILDPKSPQCKPVSQGGLPGAKGGALLNTSSNVVYDGELGGEFVASWRDQKFVEYIVRNDDGSGGGFAGIHEPDEPIVGQLRAQYGKFGKMPMGDIDGKPHELVQSFYLYGVFTPRIMVDGKPVLGTDSFRCILGFASTQIKKYQSFVDRVDGFRYLGRDPKGGADPVPIKPAIWAHRWLVTTQYESKGTNSWYGWVLGLAERNPDGSEADKKLSRLSVKDQRYIDGKEFFQLITAGTVKADFKSQAAAEETGADTSRWET